MSFDFAEVFTAAARHGVRDAHQKGLRHCFDHQGPLLHLDGDAQALKCAVYRLAWGVVDLLHEGFIVLQAKLVATPGGECLVHVDLAGSGDVADGAQVNAVLRRLELMDEPAEDALPRVRRASGRCPATGAWVDFVGLQDEGVLLRLERVFRVADEAGPQFLPYAEAARAWLIHDDGAAGGSLARRLQRLGWATTEFVSGADALARLVAMDDSGTRPALVIAIESPQVPAASLPALLPHLPPWTRCVFGVIAGSPTLCERDVLAGFDLQSMPFSPAMLNALTAGLAADAQRFSGETLPRPLTIEDRPLLLIVDDEEVNRLVAASLVESLGCEVRTAADGLQAIELCAAEPPSLVLMDLDMPRLNGFETTRRLRDLQRQGAIAPFWVVAGTAQGAPALERRCRDAGFDGFLRKPLQRVAVQAELQRLCEPARGHLPQLPAGPAWGT